jgi:hypothetical protein
LIATKYQQQEKQQEEDKEQHEIQDPLTGLIQQRLCYYRVFYKNPNCIDCNDNTIRIE